MIEENDPNKLIEDFITPEGYKCFTKTPPEKVLL
jgi:hypothetical protein